LQAGSIRCLRTLHAIDWRIFFWTRCRTTPTRRPATHWGPVCRCSPARGSTFCGRVGSSLLSALGLNDLITADVVEYEGQARALAENPGRLSDIRTRLEESIRQQSAARLNLVLPPPRGCLPGHVPATPRGAAARELLCQRTTGNPRPSAQSAALKHLRPADDGANIQSTQPRGACNTVSDQREA
jgi:hypothetical protein